MPCSWATFTATAASGRHTPGVILAPQRVHRRLPLERRPLYLLPMQSEEPVTCLDFPR